MQEDTVHQFEAPEGYSVRVVVTEPGLSPDRQAFMRCADEVLAVEIVHVRVDVRVPPREWTPLLTSYVPREHVPQLSTQVVPELIRRVLAQAHRDIEARVAKLVNAIAFDEARG